MRVLILDGPHEGTLDVPEHQGDVLQLAVEPHRCAHAHPVRRLNGEIMPCPACGSTSLSPFTSSVRRYRRVQSYPTDFIQGIEARFICVD